MVDIASGYSDYQIYLLLSCAPIQGHVGGLVDVRILLLSLSYLTCLRFRMLV